MISATKHITHGQETTGVSITVRVSDDEIWQASYDQDEKSEIIFDLPVKIIHKKGVIKVSKKSFMKTDCTNDLLEMLDTVIDMFDNAPSEKKRVLL